MREEYKTWVLSLRNDLVDLTYPDGKHRTQLSTNKLKILLGLESSKLPSHAVAPQMVGDTLVKVLSAEEAKALNPKATRPHRVMAQCNHCQSWVPAGRLHQHRKTHKK